MAQRIVGHIQYAHPEQPVSKINVVEHLVGYHHLFIWPPLSFFLFFQF